MATRQSAVDWLNAQNGKRLDFFVLWAFSVVASKTMASTVVLFTCRAANNTLFIISRPAALSSVVDFGVFISSNYNKILWPIIKLIVVYVMDYFITVEKSANLLLHYKTVFKDFVVSGLWVVGHIYNFIAFAINGFTTRPSGVILTNHHLPLALARTKDKFTFFMRAKILELLIAIGAFEKALSAFVVTRPIAKPSFLARRSFEFFFTLFANINHTISIQTSMLLVNKGV